MKRYKEYKDSGIEWIGEIPSHWKLSKLKYCTQINSETLPENTSPNYEFEYIDIGNVTLGCKLESTQPFKFCEAPSRARRIIRKGDTIVSTVRTYLKAITFVDIDRENLIASTGFAVVRPACDHYDEFFCFLLTSEKIVDCICANSVGVSYPAVTSTVIGNINVWLPTYDEQKRIAIFLKSKLSQVDLLIQNKRKMIDLLKEERAAIINHAVTKGIHPNAEMKDSGIEWLGEIPKHWNAKRLRYIGTCQNGISASAEYFGSGYPFLTYGDVYNNISTPEICSGLANSSIEDRERYSIKKGDVFFTRTSETAEEIGFSCTCLSTIENGTFSGFLIRLRPIEGLLFEGFSKYYFCSILHRKFFVKEMNLVTRASLSQDLLKLLPVLLPPYNEQVKIAEWLDSEIQRIDTVNSKISKEIALIEEYRTALINEAVTGKICVVENV